LGISSQGSVISYTYDAANEVTVETQAPTGGPTQTIKYTYTPDGLPKQLSIPNAYAKAWTYESRDLISSISDLSGNTFASYAYDPAGRLASCSLENGASTSYTYDSGSRLIKQVDSLTQGAGWPADISYNVVNEITGISHEGLGDDRTFGHSPRRNLHSVSFGGPTPGPETLATNFDPNGNWLNLKINGTLQTQYTTNTLDQYTVLTTYDSNGNPTTANLSYDGQENLAGLNGGSFQFNHENELVLGTSGTNTVQSVYDGLGRCVTRSVNGVTTYITYSGWSPILETDSSGNILDARVYGLCIDDLITELTPSLSPKFFYHEDASGNVQFVSDPNGSLIERYSYSPFGSFSIYDPNWNPQSASSVGNRFYFQGREYLAGLGIYDFRNRAYSPAIGRFLQMDPIRFAGGSNLYRFAGNDPVNGGDPLGLQELDDGGNGGSASGGAFQLPQQEVDGYLPPDSTSSGGMPFAGGARGFTQTTGPNTASFTFVRSPYKKAQPQIDVAADSSALPGGGGAGGGGSLGAALGQFWNKYLSFDKAIQQAIEHGLSWLSTPHMTPGRAFVEQNIPGLGQIDHNIDQILTHVPILIGGISGPGALGGFGNVAGGLTTVENALTGAEAYLGPNYQEIAPNVFRSADGLRQFRMNTNDLFGPSAHVHFESIAPNGRAILETSHVDIIDP
jgi:RHS repeat-associated protein